MAAAQVLIIGAFIRHRTPSVWGLRLFHLGFSLVNLIPGIGIVVAALRGQLLWPAVLAGLFACLIGVGVLYGLRISWADPARNSN